MSFRLSGCFKGYLAVAALVCGGLWVPAGLAQSQPSLEAEATPSLSSTRTNLPPRTSRPALPMNGLLRLEEQLSHTFSFLKPNGTTPDLAPTPVLPPQVAAPIQNPRAKDLLEQKKDWIFANPDDVTKGPTPEDALNLPEYGFGGPNDKSLTPVQRFYQDLDRREAAKAKKRNPLAADDPNQLREQFNASRDQEANDAHLPAGIRDSEQKLRQLLGIDGTSAAAAAPHGSFSDIFGTGDKSTTPTDEEMAHKVYMDGFNAWLNRPTTPSANNGLVLPPGATDPTRPTVVSANSLPTFAPFSPLGRPDNYDPSIGMVNPTMAVTAPQDITAKVLNQWNPYYVPPKVEPPKSAPPQPVFDVPRRKF